MERKSARSAHNEAEPLHLASEHENVFSSRIDCNVERYFAADAIRAYAEDGPDGNVAHAAPIDVRAALAPRALVVLRLRRRSSCGRDGAGLGDACGAQGFRR